MSDDPCFSCARVQYEYAWTWATPDLDRFRDAFRFYPLDPPAERHFRIRSVNTHPIAYFQRTVHRGLWVPIMLNE